MATKHISDLQVVQAFAEVARRRDAGEVRLYVYDVLASTTGQPVKVCYRAMERAFGRNLIEYGISLRSGWLTDRGTDLLSSAAKA